MLFAVGTKVRFRYTGETGIITAMLDDAMLQVRLDSDRSLEIPAFEEDLQRNTEAEPVAPGARFVAGKVEKKPEAPPRREIKAQYVILKPKGIQLVFEPMPGRDDSVSRYKTWLINDTSQEFLIEFDLFTPDKDLITVDAKLGGGVALELGDFLSDDLNEAPEAFLRIQRITTEGTDEALEKKLRIRAKQFFNNLQTVPILNLLAHPFLLFDSFEPKQEESDDLKSYTKQNLQKARPDAGSNSRPFSAFNVEEFANFLPEVDLHIQNISKGYARLDKSEIVRLQLLHFQNFLEKAIRLGVPRIYVIHGVGEGKLRDAIADRLRQHPDVLKFKNEYHVKYGYGATEVILMD
ncbi:MAG: Smr/MutS family protein [Saprospiraceae bacterium]